MEGQPGPSSLQKKEVPGSSTSKKGESVTMERLFGLELNISSQEPAETTGQLVPRSCVLHFDKSPIKVSYGQDQYLYDDGGVEYLDCVNCVAHVGRCHPEVTKAGTKAMRSEGASTSSEKTNIIDAYMDTLRTTLPGAINTFLFVSSVSEANDLALHLAKLHTGGTEIVAVEGSYHCSTTLPNKIQMNQSSSQSSECVHVLPCPDLHGGSHREDDSHAVQKYSKEAQNFIREIVEEQNKKIACLILESIMSTAGIIIPPPGWIKTVFQEIHSTGGLVIADEIQTGMGRCGSSWWAFQYQDVVPDLVTIGKPLGNGHPMAIVATTKAIASCLGPNVLKRYSCDSVSAAIGIAVLKVIRSENLLQNARNVGSFLREGLRGLAHTHRHIDDVRGVGLMVGVEIVYNKEKTRKPATDIAERICYMMKDNKIILGVDGIHKNILIIMPPSSFSCENSHRLILTLGKVLETIEAEEESFRDEQPSTSKGFRRLAGGSPTSSEPKQAQKRTLPASLYDDTKRISLEDINPDVDKPYDYSEMD